MSKLLYARMAATNLKKNGRLYRPYLLAGTGTVAMYYIISLLATDEGLSSMYGASVVMMLMSMGWGIVGVFSAIFLFYTNGFLIRQRKKEFGLYSVLGMEKRHIAVILLFETLYTGLFMVAAGLALGVLFSKLAYLGLLRLLAFEVTMGFRVSGGLMVSAAVFFGAVFLAIYAHDLWQVSRVDPVQLLRGGQVGEREPRTRWLLALTGAAALGGGYYIALTTKDPLMAVLLFFLAALLVIVGTYCLFTAGSVAVLKALRKNKRYYYKPNHFISVSGLIYRMKQNAVGLANICILSTMVLVMITCTLSLYASMEQSVADRYPFMFSMRTRAERDPVLREQNAQAAVDTARAALQAEGLEALNGQQCHYLSFTGKLRDGVLVTDRNMATSADSPVELYVVTLDSYNRLTGAQAKLGPDEVYVTGLREEYSQPTLQAFGRSFTVAGRPALFLRDGGQVASMYGTYYIVVPDDAALQWFYEQQLAAYGDSASEIRYYYGFDVAGTASEEQTDRVAQMILDSLKEQGEGKGRPATLEYRPEAEAGFYELYGGFLFLGLFLGAVFLMATVLIIYYKQVSEGYDDKARFQILQKVGMSKGEVKKAIHSQVLTVFFLPLITAGVHMAVAFPVMCRMMLTVSFTNTALFLACTAGTFLAFSAVYVLVYSLTARTYYRIVD